MYYNIEREKKVEKVSGQIAHVGKPKLGGPWVLVDHNGIPRTDASYRGKMNLLYFGFTHCPDICPNELVKVKKIVNAAGNNSLPKFLLNHNLFELHIIYFAALNGIEIKPIFISVDPVRDTVGQLKFYSKDFHPSFDFLTGTPEQVGNVAKSFRVYYSKANEDADDESEYLVDHSIVLYLISPDGEFLDFFTQKMQVNDIVDRISVHYKNVTKK